LDFDGSNDFFEHSITGVVNGSFTYVDVFKSSDTAAVLHGSTTSTTKWVMISQTNTQTILSDGFVTAYDDYFKNGLAALSSGATRTDLQNAFFDGQQNLAFYFGTTNGTATSQMYIGRYIQGGFYFSGILQESILYTSDKSSVRTDIEGNVSAYYQSAKLLDEQFGSGAEAAYSTRQLRRDQTDCMVIRRASDSTTQTIGFDANGNIDESAINTFCSGTTCTVYQWLDQSGNGNTATAAAQANEPTIYTGGAIVKENGKVAVDCANDALVAPSVTLDSYYSWYYVAKPDANGGFIFEHSADSNPNNGAYNYLGVNNSAEIYRNPNKATSNATAGGGYAGTSQTLISWNYSGAWTAYKDGSSLAIQAGQGDNGDIGDSSATDELNLFSRNESSLFFDGKFQEIIFWNNDQDDAGNRTSIESNIGDYFTQNTPLLDTYSGAAACYSLRLMRTAYTGALIRVRRSSDNTELDINANVFGELNTVSLLDFAGAGDAFVKTWYDQSGNSNDATQTTTASQPKIVSSGAVIVENGKPAVEFNGTSTEISAPTVGLSVATCFIHHTNFDANARMFGQFDQFENSFLYDTVTGYWAFNNGSINLSGLSSTTSKLVYALFDNSGGELGINGATATSGTLGVFNSQMDLRIGRRSSSYWKGTASELIVYDSDQSANRTNIESNINTFYSIS